MAKKIILYNLKKSVSDDEYKKYCEIKKGPFLVSLPSCRSFKLLCLKDQETEGVPFKYMGVIDATSMEEWQQDTSSEEFQDFRKEWLGKVADFHILDGKEVYGY